MLSRESLLLALNSGCLNSQAWKNGQSMKDSHWRPFTHAWTIWRVPALLIVVSHFMEVILVQLANKTCEVAVFEMFRKD